MKKLIKKENCDKELWFNWLTRKLNSYEAFSEFDSGKDPKDVAENFISVNKIGISEVFKRFDAEDKDMLDQFHKLTECEWHVFRILKNQLGSRNNVRFVDFQKKKK